MAFGFGLFEVVFVLFVLGLLVAVVSLGAFVMGKALRRSRPTPDVPAQHLAAELHRAQGRIAELEDRLARVERPGTFPRQ